MGESATEITGYDSASLEEFRRLIVAGSVDERMAEEPLALRVIGVVRDAEPGAKVGDKVVLRGREFTVCAVVDGYPSARLHFQLPGSDYVVHENQFVAITGCDDAHRVDVFVADGADREAVEQAVKDLQRDYPEYSYASFEQTRADLMEQSRQVKTLGLGLALLIVIVGGFGIVNTMMISIQSRRGEFGMLRAMGMEMRQTRRMVVTEGLLYRAYALATGLPAGVILSAVLHVSQKGSLRTWSFPTLPLLAATVGVAGLCVIVCLPALARLGKMSIVESMDRVE